METVKKFLFDNGLPHHVNKLNENNIDCVISSSIIIPGGIILFKSKKIVDDYLKLEKLEQQMNNIYYYAPGGSIIYIFIDNIDSDGELDTIKKYLMDSIHIDEEFDVINDVENIGIAEYSYQTTITRAIWKMCTSNVKHILNNHKIYVDEDTWRWAMTCMTEEEKDIVKEHVIIGKPTTMYNCIITNSRKDFNTIIGDKLFTEFITFYQTDSMGDKKILPVRIVDGLTDHCKVCNKIVYVPYIKDNGCIGCLSKDEYKK